MYLPLEFHALAALMCTRTHTHFNRTDGALSTDVIHSKKPICIRFGPFRRHNFNLSALRNWSHLNHVYVLAINQLHSSSTMKLLQIHLFVTVEHRCQVGVIIFHRARETAPASRLPPCQALRENRLQAGYNVAYFNTREQGGVVRFSMFTSSRGLSS